MKAIALTGIAGLALGASGCVGVDTAAKDIAAVVAHSQQACTDLSQLGATPSQIAAQVAAANPNSPQIQAAAAKVQAGASAANSDCQKLAAAFTAEAPASQLERKVKIDPAVWSLLKSH